MKKTIMISVISAVLALGTFPALAAGGYGSIVPNGAVTQAFEKNQADPNLIYYHSGSSIWPDAIIGVNKAYTLDSTLWQKCVSEASLKNHITGMKFGADVARRNLQGYSILDDMGMKIGVWYSMPNTPTFVRRESEKAIDIHTPNRQNNLDYILNN